MDIKNTEEIFKIFDKENNNKVDYSRTPLKNFKIILIDFIAQTMNKKAILRK